VPDPEELLRIDAETVGGATVLILGGELDLAAEPALTAALLASEEDAGGVIAVDLTGLEFMDSTGSRVLIEAHLRAEAAGRRFVVVAGEGPAREVLERSGLVDHLAVADAVAGIPDARPAGDGREPA
jgi:anti-sigma B factor antagonist